jgi:hypothetical protein
MGQSMVGKRRYAATLQAGDDTGYPIRVLQ